MGQVKWLFRNGLRKRGLWKVRNSHVTQRCLTQHTNALRWARFESRKLPWQRTYVVWCYIQMWQYWLVPDLLDIGDHPLCHRWPPVGCYCCKTYCPSLLAPEAILCVEEASKTWHCSHCRLHCHHHRPQRPHSNAPTALKDIHDRWNTQMNNHSYRLALCLQVLGSFRSRQSGCRCTLHSLCGPS
jgi:hypothetical protein